MNWEHRIIAKNMRVGFLFVRLIVPLYAVGGETPQNTWTGVKRIVAVEDNREEAYRIAGKAATSVSGFQNSEW